MKDIISRLKETKLDNRVRLGIMSMLVINDEVEFKVLKEMLGVSDGNLASHIKVLEAEKYLEVRKQFVGKKPKTTYIATSTGSKAFKDHLSALEELIKKKEE